MKYRYQSGDMIYEVQLERSDTGYRVTINGEVYDLELLDAQPGALSLRLGSDAAAFRPQVVYNADDGNSRWFSSQGCTYRLDRPQARRARAATRGSAEDGQRVLVRAPMPAQVRGLQVAAGDTVAAGQTLLLLEAMKMEIRVQAPAGGRVARLLVSSGAQVERDQVLVELT